MNGVLLKKKKNQENQQKQQKQQIGSDGIIVGVICHKKKDETLGSNQRLLIYLMARRVYSIHSHNTPNKSAA